MKEEEKEETSKSQIDIKAKDSGAESEMETEEDKQDKVSKKKLKKLARLSVAQLKQLVKRPEVVEVQLYTSYL